MNSSYIPFSSDKHPFSSFRVSLKDWSGAVFCHGVKEVPSVESNPGPLDNSDVKQHSPFELASFGFNVEYEIILGDVIDPDRQIDLYCDQIDF